MLSMRLLTGLILYSNSEVRHKHQFSSIRPFSFVFVLDCATTPGLLFQNMPESLIHIFHRLIQILLRS